MKISELTKKRLLRKASSSNQEIEGSISIAKHFLQRARGNHKIEFFDVSFSLAYQSMFHAARALLFKKGLKEKSHFALIAGLKEIYSDNHELKNLLDVLDSYRISRHAIQYTGVACNELDSKEAIKTAQKLIGLASSILQNEAK